MIYGIREKPYQYKFKGEIYNSLSLYFTAVIENEIYEIPLLEVEDRYIQVLDPEKIYIKEINNDNFPEIILYGNCYYIVGEIDSYVDSSEYWFNIRDDEIIKIFHKKFNNNFKGSILRVKYNFIKNNENFIEKIEEIVEHDNEYIDTQKYRSKLFYLWKNNKYEPDIKHYTPTVNNLRLRDSPDLNGRLIKILKTGDKITMMDKGKEETIDGIKGQWIYVMTEDHRHGWCFNGYLKEIE